MELQTALLTKFWTVLTTDATLIAAMGGAVRLYHVWGVEDAVFPYLVHRIDMRANEGEWVTRNGTYIIDIWSTTNSGAEAFSIRDRIITLFDELSFNVTEATGVRIWLQTEGPVPEDTYGLWHYILQWNLKFARTVEISNIVNR